MKKTIGLALLLLSGMTAFAAPLARTEGFQKTAIVAHKQTRKSGHRRGVKKAGIRKANYRKASFRMRRQSNAR
jgi:hypothetical protein